MQVQRHSQRFPVQLVAVILARVAAALLGGDAGYQLRAHGYPAVNASSTTAPATAPTHRVTVREPDAAERSNQAVSVPAPTATVGSQQGAPTHGQLP
jgi:hypothetical protein